ncbi:MAG: transcription repressor NadR [Fervidobacterium sp.]|nr:transcription repressor NadR [Fervidobacterium sp.]
MDRKQEILEILKRSKVPVKGKELAERLGVSRQIIVSDISQLREEGFKIVSTRDGYVIDSGGRVRRIVAVKHSAEEIYDELKTIVENGGKVIDVIVEHPVYGEIIGRIDVSTLDDVEKFMTILKSSNTKPLLEISGGIHLHTIEAPDEDTMQKILRAIEKYRLK